MKVAIKVAKEALYGPRMVIATSDNAMLPQNDVAAASPRTQSASSVLRSNTPDNKRLDDPHKNYSNGCPSYSTECIDCPIGCVIVKNGLQIAARRNEIELKNDPTAHAELLCIKSACMELQTRYLVDCTLYCTLEPCPMCAEAIRLARISRVIFGAFRTDLSITRLDEVGGILENECSSLLSGFFGELRR